MALGPHVACALRWSRTRHRAYAAQLAARSRKLSAALLLLAMDPRLRIGARRVHVRRACTFDVHACMHVRRACTFDVRARSTCVHVRHSRVVFDLVSVVAFDWGHLALGLSIRPRPRHLVSHSNGVTAAMARAGALLPRQCRQQ